MNETQQPKHGTKRNYRRVVEPTTFIEATNATTGVPLRIPSPGAEYSVVERYCTTDQAWIEARGIVGAMFCPKCKEVW